MSKLVKEIHLPANSVLLSNDKMKQVIGGMKVRMYEGLKTKDGAKAEASGIKQAAGNYLGNLPWLDLAKELFAHAVVYYDWRGVLSVINTSWSQSIIASVSDGIDIENGLDSRSGWFDTIWNLSIFS